MKTTLATFSLGVASVALLASCANTGSSSGSAESVSLKAAVPAQMAGSCADLATKFNYAQLRMTGSTAVAAGAVALNGAPSAPKTAYDAPSHCLVKGVMDAATPPARFRPGSSGTSLPTPYASSDAPP